MRRPQFSLKTLLWLMVVAGAFCSQFRPRSCEILRYRTGHRELWIKWKGGVALEIMHPPGRLIPRILIRDHRRGDWILTQLDIDTIEQHGSISPE
jgi:hypothetical protein